MDTIQLTLLALLVGAVILDTLYRFRVLRQPPPYDDEPRRSKPKSTGKKRRHQGDRPPYDRGNGSGRSESRGRSHDRGGGGGGRGLDRPIP
jgi:hypothetical protein